MLPATLQRNAEGKYRTNAHTKKRATECLPFEMRDETPSYDMLSAHAHKASVNADGVVTLPAGWDDDGECRRVATGVGRLARPIQTAFRARSLSASWSRRSVSHTLMTA